MWWVAHPYFAPHMRSCSSRPGPTGQANLEGPNTPMWRYQVPKTILVKVAVALHHDIWALGPSEL